MKITLDWPLRTLSGKDLQKGVVYQSCRDDTLCIMRRYVRPRITEHNHYTGAKFKSAILLYKVINPEFMRDLIRYTDAFNNQLLPEKKLPLNQYNTFLKALLNKKVRLSDLDNFRGFAGIFGNTIEAWIANGLLPKVRAKFAGVEAWVICDSRQLVVDSRQLAVDSREVTVDSRQLAVDSRQTAVDSREVAGDRVVDVCEPAIAVTTPIVASEPSNIPKPSPKTANTARQAWRNRPKTEKTTMYMQDLLNDSDPYIIPMPPITVSKDKELVQLKNPLTQNPP